MYKNFKLTDEERKQIMEMHGSHGYKKPINEKIYDSEYDVVRGNPDFKLKIGKPVGDYLANRDAAKQFQQDFQKEFPDPAEEPIPFWEKDQARPSGESDFDYDLKKDARIGDLYAGLKRKKLDSADPSDPGNPMGISVQDVKQSWTKKEELDKLEKKITALRLFKDQFGLDDHMTELYNNLLIKYREDSRDFFRGGVK